MTNESNSLSVTDASVLLDDAASRAETLFSAMDESGVEHERMRPAYEDPVVAEKEQKAVIASRLVMILVILIALTCLSVTMYLVISNSEKVEFETQVR